ncbi:MAG: hypothetical protein WBJ21_08220 [Burkholderiaceae bacterium]
MVRRTCIHARYMKSRAMLMKQWTELLDDKKRAVAISSRSSQTLQLDGAASSRRFNML